MRILLLLLATIPALLGVHAPTRGEGAVRGVGASHPAADTIVWELGRPRPLLDVARGGVADPDPTLRLGLKPLRLEPALDPPPVPGLDHPLLQRPGASYGERWTERILEHATTRSMLRTALLRSLDRLIGPERDPGLAFLPPRDTARTGLFERRRPRAEPGDTMGTAQEIQTFVSDYADLGMRVQTRAELGGDWARFTPCEARFQESCTPSLVPQLSPELRFNVQVAGTISDRLHVDVDFDQLREFESANTLNIFYEGAEDDIIRRLELGDVTFGLPASRFLTEGIPAGNFGFQAEGQLGPVDFQAVWAEQKGDVSRRVFRLSGVGSQRRFVQEDTLEVDDADYVRGQFFFLVDPRNLAEYPHVDVLSLDAGAASPLVLPGVEPVQLYRFENDPVLRQQVEGFIQADAVARRGGDRVVESGWFRYLQPGQDYFVHPSGLWVALRNPLSREEMLAVTYITAAGDTVGDYNPERIFNRNNLPQLRLLKASGANHQPDRPTWELEMHNIYRVSGSPDVESASVDVTVSLGELSAGRTFKRAVTGEDVTFLRLFGLDRESPFDRVDQSVVYSPGQDLFQGQPPVQGTFVVFPTLEPFRRPPPLEVFGLDDDDTSELLGDDANVKIYDDPDPFERQNGGRFRLTIPFRRRSEGVITSFSLGAIGILPQSERIFLGERLLVRGVDYHVDYDVGQVTLEDPATLFAATPDAPVRATWEQRQIFRQTPTSVFGLTAHTRLGRAGGLDFLGLYRTEKTLVNRPTLGLEPGAVGLGGVNGRVTDQVEWLDRLLDRIPGLRFAGRSTFTLDGEAAVSLPNPNTQDDVFLDDFDASNQRRLSLLSFDWQRGSAPAFVDGAEDVLPPAPGPEELAEIVWQHQWIVEGTAGDSVGVREGFLPREEIDQQIRLAGSQIREPGLLLTFGRRGLFGRRRWGSVTTVLSATGADLSKSEFLEFYASGTEELTLVMDLGTVSEDAMFVTDDGRTQGVKENGAPWGLGRLDHEADPRRGEIWGDQADRRGVWDEDCLAERGRIYRRGDPTAVCTRGNGRQDTEDLDRDSNLDTRERYLRYVVPLGVSSPFLARDTTETRTSFRLYRIPLEGLRAVEVGGPITEADMRAVRHLRVTVTGDLPGSLILARMSIIGSRWIKRAEQGALRGIIGDTVAVSGRVEVTPVSRLTEGEAYQSPPDVLERLSDPTAAFAGQSLEFNEKSLSVTFRDIEPGDRAEIYNRFPQRPRNFLDYREARLWVVARSGDFRQTDPHFFYFKVGSDTENFYLFRTRLRAPPPGGAVTTADWRPEIRIDFQEWFDLRRRAEETLIHARRGPGDPPVTVWSSDSTYAVVLKDRGRAPDLANVREMAMGVWNDGGDRPISGEFWVDELRLGRSVRDLGLAAFANARLEAADVMDTRVTVSSRGAFFRQLEENPTYQTDRVLSVHSRFRLERFTPTEWGVELPLTLTFDRAVQDPTFLANSDVPARDLEGLRETGTKQTRVSLGFRKRTPSANPVVSALLDGLDVNLSWFDSRTSSVTVRRESEGVDARLSYSRRLDYRDVGVVPSFLRPVLRRLLPGFLEEDLVDARLRWTPERFSVGSSYARHENEFFRFDQIIELARDSLVRATPAPREALETAAEIRFRPFPSVTADLTFLSTRDLLGPEESVSDRSVQELLARERARLAGVDFGWETHRAVRTRFGLRPQFVSWLRHSLDITTSYVSNRNATFVERHVQGLDTMVALQRNASGDRNVQAFIALDPAVLAGTLPGGTGPGSGGEEPAEEGGAPAEGGEEPAEGGEEPAEEDEAAPDVVGGPSTLQGLIRRIQPMTVNFQTGLASRFNRDPIGPGAGYQLGFGGVRDFRFIDDDTAAMVTDRSTWRLSSGLQLSRDVLVELGYTATDIDILDTRSNRTVESETWPDLLATVDHVRGGDSGLRRVSVSSGFQRNVREVEFGGPAQQLRRQTDRQIPVELSLTWQGALSFRYSGAFRTGDGVDPTGDTERDRTSHRLTFNSSFTPPERLLGELDRPVQMGVIVSYTGERECRAARFREGCTAFIDQINRGLSVTMDTAVQGFEVGLQASFTDRQSFIGLNQGSTQFQLGLWGQLLFESGTLPGAGPRR